MTHKKVFRGQFHPHFTQAFLPIYFCQNVTEKLREAFSYEKRSRKMLMKSTPGPKNIQNDRNIRK